MKKLIIISSVYCATLMGGFVPGNWLEYDLTVYPKGNETSAQEIFNKIKKHCDCRAINNKLWAKKSDIAGWMVSVKFGPLPENICDEITKDLIIHLNENSEMYGAAVIISKANGGFIASADVDLKTGSLIADSNDVEDSKE